MARALPLPPPGFDTLSVEEKLDYVQSLWDRIFAHPDEVPVPEWHRQVVGDRLAAHRADPESALPWDDVRDELREKLRNRLPRG